MRALQIPSSELSGLKGVQGTDDKDETQGLQQTRNVTYDQSPVQRQQARSSCQSTATLTGSHFEKSSQNAKHRTTARHGHCAQADYCSLHHGIPQYLGVRFASTLARL